MTQNYTTIDKYSVNRFTYVKLSSVRDLDIPHFVVATYKEAGREDMDTYTNTMLEVWHFTGDLAEVEATNFYCSMIPDLAPDFPSVDLTKCVSYQPQRHYVYSPESRDENAGLS